MLISSLVCLIFLIIIYSSWKTRAKIVRNGVVLPATIVRHGWHRIIFITDIVRFTYQGKDIEIETSVSAFGIKKVGFQFEIIYWDGLPEKLVVKDKNHVLVYIVTTIFVIVASMSYR